MTRYILALALLIMTCPGCSNAEDDAFQGYIEGEYVYLASERGGRLETLAVQRGASVDAGAALFRLTPDPERQLLQQAEQEWLAATALLRDMETGKRPEEVAMAVAQLERAQVDEANARVQWQRNVRLFKVGGVSRAQLDDAEKAAKTAEALVAELRSQVAVYHLPDRAQRIAAQQATAGAAEAKVAQARWNLEQKRVAAPSAGLVYDTLYLVGEWVPAGNPVVQLLPPGNVKIRFFVPETRLAGIHVGNSVRVLVDGREAPVTASVSYISQRAEYTPPVIYSNATRSKLVFMVEALPEPDVAALLHPGQPVSVRVP